LNGKSVIGALFICTALICSTLAYFLAGILGSIKPNIDMLRKKWMYTQLDLFVPYWLIAAFVVIFAIGFYLLMDKSKEKQ